MAITRLLRKLAFAGMLFAVPVASYAQFSLGISINIAPPALPVYVQPPCPQPNLIWTPGYWAWDPDVAGYYWVPGTWIAAPQPGFLWTPGYWGWGDGGVYLFHAGYWGQHVGFYGGVNYGFGYGGFGFGGGEWRGGTFAYNTAVVNVNTTVIHNTYINKTVINNTTVINNHTSFNGGPNGVAARPTEQERSYASERHIEPTTAQTQHLQVARQDKSNFASANHGLPAHAATPRPVANVAELQHSAVPARGARPASASAQRPMQNHPAANQRPAQSQRPAQNARPETAQRPQQEARPAARPQQENRPAPARRPAAEAKPAPRPAAERPAERPKEERPQEHRR